MSTTELVLNMLAEAATKDITQISHPQGLEEETGKPVITQQNAIDFAAVIEQVAKQVKK